MRQSRWFYAQEGHNLVDAVLLGIVIAVALVAVISLLLTLGLAKRLRLGEAGGGLSARQQMSPPPGTEIPAFAATLLDGREVSDSDLRVGEHLLAFIAEGCGPCAELVGELRADPPSDPFYVFATGNGSNEFFEELRSIQHFANVIFVGRDTQLGADFGIRAVPTMIRLRDGIVETTARRIPDTRGARGDRTSKATRSRARAEARI